VLDLVRFLWKLGLVSEVVCSVLNVVWLVDDLKFCCCWMMCVVSVVMSMLLVMSVIRVSSVVFVLNVGFVVIMCSGVVVL